MALAINLINFAASHNSCCTGDRPNECRSLLEQLDFGIRLIEFDFFGKHLQHLGRFEIGHASPGKEVQKFGNPRSLDLEHWLQTVDAWAHRRNWQIGGPLFLVLDAKDTFPVSPLNELVNRIFGDRIFGPDELDRCCPQEDSRQTWPTASHLDGRVLLVLSGDERNRMMYLRDEGCEPAIASNAAGSLVEVHKSQNYDTLWFWSGGIQHGDHSVEWVHHGQYSSGVTPTVVLTSDSWVVEVHKSQNYDILWYCVARMDPQTHDLSWYSSQEIKPQPKSAKQPKLELIGGMLHLRCLGDGGAWHCTGQLSAPGIVEWSKWEQSDTPIVSSATAELSVSNGHKLGSQHALMWQRGQETGLIRPRQLFFVEAQPTKDKHPLIEYGTHFLAWPANKVVVEAQVQRWHAEGRLLRQWKFNHTSWCLDRILQPHFPATDFPLDPQYVAYVKSLKAVAD